MLGVLGECKALPEADEVAVLGRSARGESFAGDSRTGTRKSLQRAAKAAGGFFVGRWLGPLRGCRRKGYAARLGAVPATNVPQAGRSRVSEIENRMTGDLEGF